jgi:hypothetical protein
VLDKSVLKGTSFCGAKDGECEKMPERKMVTYGVDLTKLEEWLASQKEID